MSQLWVETLKINAAFSAHGEQGYLSALPYLAHFSAFA
jgi:hypothetical protein